MINCIVVDDEPLARDLIVSYIDQVPNLDCLGTYENALGAFAALHTHPVDVIFIDIEMPGINGLHFIKSLQLQTKVIFITAYEAYALDAFDVEAIDYIVKPVVFDRFLKAVNKVMKSGGDFESTNLQQKGMTHIFLKVDRRLVKIELNAILYLEGLGDYVKVHTNNQVLISYTSLGKMEKMLMASPFTRIHRSIIVNQTHIVFIEGNFVRVQGVDLPIGQTYREELLKKIQH